MIGDTPPVPRSVRLALWLTAEGRSRPGAPAAPRAGAARRVLEAVRGDDEPHCLLDPASPRRGPTGFWDSDPGTFAEVVARWLDAGCCAVALLPGPDDDEGLPVMASGRAVRAGECVLLTSDRRDLLAVPEVETFGSRWEQGHAVAWSLHDVGPWRRRVADALGDLAGARAALRSALIGAAPLLGRFPAQEDDAPGSRLPPLDDDVHEALAHAARARALVDEVRRRTTGPAAADADPIDAVDRSARRLMAAATLAAADAADCL